VPGGSQVSQRLARSQMRRAGREQVVIEDGSRPVCSFGVTAGRGSCLLTDTALGVGIGRLTAYAYPNNGSLTAAASAIIARMRHRGLIVDAFKATGVSLRRDILAFEDSGARRTMIFTDLGIITTTAKCGPALTRTMLTDMALGLPDVIVFELGDGLLGTYGVESILRQPDIKAALSAVVLSANDPVAAWGGVKLLRERFGIEPCAVTGPATDNQVGVEIIREQMNVEAFNAISHPADLGDHIIDKLGLRNVRESKVVGE